MSQAGAKDPLIEEWIDAVEARWASAGVTGARRAGLRADLVADLEQASADGAPVDELLAEDPAAFAARVARASEVPRSRLARRPAWRFSVPGLMLGLLGGAVAGFVLALFTVYPGGMYVSDELELSYEQEGWVAVGMHVLAAAFSLAGALMVLAWAFPVRASAARTLVGLGAGVLAGGVASIWPTMALAHRLDYSFAPGVVLLEIAMVVGFCLAGAWVAWKVLQRAPRRDAVDV